MIYIPIIYTYTPELTQKLLRPKDITSGKQLRFPALLMARTLRISGIGEADKQDKSAWHLVFSWWVGAVSCQQVNILETLQWVSWYPGLKNGYCVYITSKNQVRKGSVVKREVGGCLRQEHKGHIPGGALAALCWFLSSIQYQRNHTDGHTGLGWGPDHVGLSPGAMTSADRDLLGGKQEWPFYISSNPEHLK